MALFNSRHAAEPSAQEGKRSPRGRQAVDTVEDMRRRARHRLIGACLLVLAGIVVFPILFDTQPRPIAVNSRVEIPGVDSAPPLTLPAQAAASRQQQAHGLEDGEELVDTGAPTPSAAKPAPASGGKPAAPASAPTASVAQTAARNSNAARGEQRPADAPAAQRAPQRLDSANVAASAPKPAAAPDAAAAAAKPPVQVAAVPPPPAVRVDEAARARALLEGKPVETVVPGRAEQGRFIVQVGAYTDEAKVREVRGQLEKLGLRTYTQVVQTPTGRATRVRVGPFGSRDEADKAAVRIKTTNLPTVILTL